MKILSLVEIPPLGHRIARLNGPIGRRAVEMTMSGFLPEVAGGSPRSIDAKMPPISATIGDVASKRRQGTATSHPTDTARTGEPFRKEPAPLKHSASTGSLLPQLKAQDDGFLGDKSVRFLPPRVRASRHPKIMSKRFLKKKLIIFKI